MKKGISITFSLCLLYAGPAQACGEFLDWHVYPQIESIAFVGKQLLLQPKQQPQLYAVTESRSFIFSPSERLMRPVIDASLQVKEPSGYTSASEGPMAQLAKELSLEISEPYCAEGEGRHRTVTIGDKVVKLDLDPCLSITALEYNNDHLFFGSSYVGECVMEGKGGGVEIRNLSSWSLAGKIPVNELPGELVRAIGVNHKDETIWIATERGLAQFDSSLNKLWQGNYCEEFGGEQHEPRFRLSETTCLSDDFATLARLLDIRDTEKYYQRVSSLSAEVRRKLDFMLFFMSGSYEEHPAEINFLVDYFIEAYLNGDKWTREFALWNICDFNDPAARAFMLMKDAEPETDSRWDIWRDNCAIREEKGRWRNRNPLH